MKMNVCELVGHSQREQLLHWRKPEEPWHLRAKALFNLKLASQFEPQVVSCAKDDPLAHIWEYLMSQGSWNQLLNLQSAPDSSFISAC